MSPSERTSRCKELGQFFTPGGIAGLMARFACAGGPRTVTDPAVGHCALLDACRDLRGPSGLIGYDVDPEISRYVSGKTDYSFDFRHRDYLEDWGAEWDAVVCNPPYMKFQRIPDRKRLTDMFEEHLGIRLSGYTNLLGYFLVKGLSELKDGARAAYLIPYEFLNNNYGTAIKRMLLEERSLYGIMKFDNSRNVFDDAITTTCIILLEKNRCDSVLFTDIKDGEQLENFDPDRPVSWGLSRPRESLDPAEKWLRYFSGEDPGKGDRNLVPLSRLGQVMRGIATGDNGFFTLNRSTIDRFGISEECLMPCICRSPDITGAVFTEREFSELESRDRRVYIFNGCNAETDSDLEYIEYGESTGASEKYLTSHRSPWYAVERRDVAPILIGAFGRDEVKVVMNEAGVHTLAPFHGLYLNPEYSDERSRVVVFSYLLSSSGQAAVLGNRREYGSKLDRYQPGDLNGCMVLDPGCVSDADSRIVMEAYRVLRETGGREEFLKTVDPVFERYSERSAPCMSR